MNFLMKRNIKSFKIINKLGLHARAAALFVKAANRFQSEIFVTKGRARINGKSIMGLLMLAAGRGSRITVEAYGQDGDLALEKLGKLISKGFNEEE